MKFETADHKNGKIGSFTRYGSVVRHKNGRYAFQIVDCDRTKIDIVRFTIQSKTKDDTANSLHSQKIKKADVAASGGVLTSLDVSTSDLSSGAKVDTDEFTLEKKGNMLCSFQCKHNKQCYTQTFSIHLHRFCLKIMYF